MLIYFLQRWPSWISDRHKKHKFGKGHSNDHSFTVWVQRKRSLKFQPIRAYYWPRQPCWISDWNEKQKFVEDHPRNIPAKFGSNWPSGFGEEAWNVKSLQTTDAKWWQLFTWTFIHLDQRSRWTKKYIYNTWTEKYWAGIIGYWKTCSHHWDHFWYSNACTSSF